MYTVPPSSLRPSWFVQTYPAKAPVLILVLYHRTRLTKRSYCLTMALAEGPFELQDVGVAPQDPVAQDNGAADAAQAPTCLHDVLSRRKAEVLLNDAVSQLEPQNRVWVLAEWETSQYRMLFRIINRTCATIVHDTERCHHEKSN